MKIGIIGFGHLGKALARGLLCIGFSADDICICAKSLNTLSIAEKEYGFKAYRDINQAIHNADAVFFVLGGNVFEEISGQIDLPLLKNKAVVSFMAGITIQAMQNRLGNFVNITRAMPSIAIEKGNGVIGYTAVKDSRISELFHKLGFAFEVEERDIEKVTAFSACGLGFAAYILNAFQQTGISLGFDSETSRKIVVNTFENALEKSDYMKTVSEVATKGGATEQGILCFQEQNISGIIEKAVRKAYQK